MKEIILNLVEKIGCKDLDLLKNEITKNTNSAKGMIDITLNGDYTNEEKFLKLLAQHLEIVWSSKLKLEKSEILRQIFPASLALQTKVLPIFSDDKKVKLAFYNPFDLLARQRINKHFKRHNREIKVIEWLMTSRTNVFAGLKDLYGVGGDTFEKILAEKGERGDNEIDLREETNVIDEDNKEASVMRFVNQIIRESLRQRATDIHIEPVKDNLRIRYRIDGVLREAPVPSNINALRSSVLARLKVMSRLDIAEKRRPQDGRIRLQLENQDIDVRVACVPSVEGESINLRLLGQENFTLDKLSFLSTEKEKILHLLDQPNGIIIVTGPTGAGKSTTLYSFLSKLNLPGRKIVTIEDPVEHKINGVVQIAVKPEINVTFASGLRSILRADPDIVMVGEMRDTETAEIAIRSALTGHLVFSTLHANNSTSGITRLLDMGLEPFLVAASVRAFIAQRLVRKLCENCKQRFSPSLDELRLFNLGEDFGGEIFKANENGCRKCHGLGYFGRLAIYEICEIDSKVEDLVARRAGQTEILRALRKNGFTNLREYGWRKILAGETSMEEVLSVTQN